jgi:hypothetical protein
MEDRGSRSSILNPLSSTTPGLNVLNDLNLLERLERFERKRCAIRRRHCAAVDGGVSLISFSISLISTGLVK